MSSATVERGVLGTPVGGMRGAKGGGGGVGYRLNNWSICLGNEKNWQLLVSMTKYYYPASVRMIWVSGRFVAALTVQSWCNRAFPSNRAVVPSRDDTYFWFKPL